MKKLLLSISIAATAAAIFTGVQVFAYGGTASGTGYDQNRACQEAKDSAYRHQSYPTCTSVDISSCHCSPPSFTGGSWSCYVQYECKS